MKEYRNPEEYIEKGWNRREGHFWINNLKAVRELHFIGYNKDRNKLLQSVKNRIELLKLLHREILLKYENNKLIEYNELVKDFDRLNFDSEKRKETILLIVKEGFTIVGEYKHTKEKWYFKWDNKKDVYMFYFESNSKKDIITEYFDHRILPHLYIAMED